MHVHTGDIYTPEQAERMNEAERKSLVEITAREAEMYGGMNRAARRRAARQLRKHGRGYTK